jgi:hypothetical protein
MPRVERPAKAPNRLRRTIILVTLVVVTVAVGITLFAPWWSNARGPIGYERLVRLRSFAGPIPGVRTTLTVARSAVTFADFPSLGSPTVKDPCVDATSPLQLLETWVNTETAGTSVQLGFVYSHGVWMSVAPAETLAHHAFDPDGELVSAEKFFAGEEGARLRSATVRGHVAWVKGFSSDFSCETDAAPIEAGGQSQAPPVDGTDTNSVRIFDPTKTASLRWAERGLVLHLTGPFTVDELSQIAESMSFSES